MRSLRPPQVRRLNHLPSWSWLFKHWIAIHRINFYPADNAIVSVILLRWIVICLVDSAIQRLNNRGLVCNNEQYDTILFQGLFLQFWGKALAE